MELNTERIMKEEMNKKKMLEKKNKTGLKRAAHGLLALGAAYLLLTMIILVGCIWGVDSGTYKIMGTIMILLIPLVLLNLVRFCIYYKALNPEVRFFCRNKEELAEVETEKI